MKEKFSIKVDRCLGLVRITVSGLPTLKDVRDFYETRRKKAGAWLLAEQPAELPLQRVIGS